MSLIWLILLVILTLIIVNNQPLIEHATSPGTLLQLVAKGPQDLYLTGPPVAPWDRYYYRRFHPYRFGGYYEEDNFPFYW